MNQGYDSGETEQARSYTGPAKPGIGSAINRPQTATRTPDVQVWMAKLQSSSARLDEALNSLAVRLHPVFAKSSNSDAKDRIGLPPAMTGLGSDIRNVVEQLDRQVEAILLMADMVEL